MFPTTLLDTRGVHVRLDHIECRQLVPLIQDPSHMKHTVMEDLNSDLLIGQFTSAIVEDYNSHRIVSESRGGNSLWIPTLDPIALGLSSTQDSSLLDLDNTTFKWHVVQHFVRV